MSLNWVEIDEVLKELALEGAFLQNVRQSDYHHLWFEFYSPGRPRQVLVCLAPQRTRIHEVTKRPATLVKAPRFVQFLRARLTGARVTQARQLGAERVVLWRLKTDDAEFHLWIRLWGGAANILVTDAVHTVLEAAFRRPKSNEVSGAVFNPEAELRPGPAKPYALRDLPAPEGEPEASYSQRLELLYSAPVEDVEKVRDQALRLVDRRLTAQAQTRERLVAQRAESDRREDWKTYADVLTSDSWRVEPGQATFEGVDWRDSATFRIELDPKLTAHENAQRLYKRYQKARDAAETVERELVELAAEEERWHHHAERLVEADAAELHAFLEKHRVVRTPQTQTKDKEARPGLEFVSGQFTLWVGRNARENDALLRRYVRGSDLWLHTRDVPGGYVFVRAVKGKTIPLETLLDAGTLAVLYSKARDGRADLYYTPVKHLRRAKDGPLGLVLPTHEKNLTVALDRTRVDRLFEGRDQSQNEK